MKILPITKILASAILAAGLFSSCSKQITSTGRIDKLTAQETMTTSKTETKNKNSVCIPETKITEKTVEQKVALVPTLKHSKIMSPAKFKSQVQNFVKTVPTAAVNVFKNQTAAIGNIAKNSHIASQSGTKHTAGMLGIAGICLIAAIALAIFGLAGSSAVFYYIAGVLFIAAVVFFLLYLLAKAAGPSTE